MLRRCRLLPSKDRSFSAQIARKHINDVLVLGREIDALGKQIKAAITATGTPLLTIDGFGPFVTAGISTQIGDPTLFTRKAKFAMCNDAAPLEANSGRVFRHRLDCGGNRQLNKAIHIAAITQIRWLDTEGSRCCEKRLTAGKAKREAIRALKRQISDRIRTALKTPPTAPH